jgi:hypothetical protein
MANNIKIVGNILNSSTISRYSTQDTNLITSQKIQDDFGASNDYIEYYIYDVGGNLLDINYNYNDFKLPFNSSLTPLPNTATSNTTNSIPTTDSGIVSNTNSQSGSLYPIIEIDPVQDLQNIGYTSGEFNVQYNFFKNKISSPSAELFIKEISPDRTEIGVISTILTDEEIEQGFDTLVSEISGSIYFVDYLLNFGDNQQVLTVNVALNKLDSGYEIYFKLYEPLPSNIVEKTTLWVVDEKVDPYTFNINLDTLILPPTGSQLRGPNFNIPINLEQGTISTSYQNYDTLLNNLQSVQSSSYSKILNLLTTQSIDINVDYTNFSNFSFFGSVKSRLQNFRTKLEKIETYNNLINSYTEINNVTNLSVEITASQNNVNDIISQFDGFEYYLYYESSSYAWPKSTSTLPYSLYPVNSLSGSTWYNAYINSAEIYDENNVNSLKNSLPSFILDDCNNDQYIVFLNMIGQYFDNIWIFLKAITDINLANNNLEQGVSKDLVYQVLKSYGIKLYNAQGGEDLDQFLIGANTGSANFDNNFTPTGSYLNNIPRKDLLAETYKRIYHNLPYLVKNKGTVTGVEGLLTTFGISNRDYYTITGSGNTTEYYYTPTGSALTSSILNTKEFGGSLKSELLKGYNNDKVRIVNNPITGSTLSYNISLQQPPTSSNEFIDEDLHYLDVSFSPQSQIDTYISGAINSNNPSFILDDYIGDPRQQYDNTYADLDAQRKLYFETGVPGYAPFTGSDMDYNGFIRLIQFFDNSLFKMIADFIPARTSLSTGVTINSPVLERNKVSYAEPLLDNQLVYDADYNGPGISPQYGQLYNNLTGSKSPFFTGELVGSEIDIYNDYFLPANYNPFLQPTSSLTTTDLNIFNHSDFNVLLNNVSASRVSLTRQGIDFIIGNTGFLSDRTILTPVELQDSNQSLTSFARSRYEGTKTTSLRYNNYTSLAFSPIGEVIYEGDKSFGKTAAIDQYVRKIGLLTQVRPNLFFPRRNNTSIKYLVDEKGNLNELNQQNKYWEEVQNTFVAGDNLTVTLFDSQKFSNQKSTNGVKPIFNSGYIYEPVFYFLSASGYLGNEASLQDLTASFDYSGVTINKTFQVIPSAGTIATAGGNYSLQTIGSEPIGSGNTLIPQRTGSDNINDYIAYNLFNINFPSENGGYNDNVLVNGGYSSFIVSSSYYNVPVTNNYNFTADFKIKVSYTTSNRTFNSAFRIRNALGNVLGAISQGFTSQEYYTLTIFNPDQKLTNPNFSYTPSPTGGSPITLEEPIKIINPNGGPTIFLDTDGSTITLEPYIIKYYVNNLTYDNSRRGPSYRLLSQDEVYKEQGANVFYRKNELPPQKESVKDNILEYKLNVSNQFLKGSDKIYFEFIIKDGSLTSPAPIVEIISGGSLKVDFSTGNTSIFKGNGFITFNTDENIINLSGKDSELSQFYSPNFTFIPTGSSLSTSNLYDSYGPVNYPFQLEIGDTILLTQNTGSLVNEYTITSINPNQTNINFSVEPPFSENISATLYSAVFLRKIPDETNVILNFNKSPGDTSYGFIIPSNLHPDVLANIDTITKEVKQKLLADQQGIGINNINTLDGGGFG